MTRDLEELARLAKATEDIRPSEDFIDAVMDSVAGSPVPRAPNLRDGVQRQGRWAMLLAGLDNLRDVIAFPKTQRGQDLLMDAPTPVSQDQLDELGIRVPPPAEAGE